MCAGGRLSCSEESFTSQPSNPPPQGTKRKGDDAVANEQRLSKRFHLLNLGDKTKESLWIPPKTSASPLTDSGVESQQKRANSSSLMQVDDTKDRIYIRDLDEELGSTSDVPDQERMIFLPDIERSLNKIPKHILQADDRPRVTGTEVVLYSVPSSLSVPIEQDGVRRAIIESRARARKASRDALERDYGGDFEPGRPQEPPFSSGNARPPDEDAMDIG